MSYNVRFPGEAYEKTVRSMNLRGELYSFERPRVMGILNITPDSFYAGSRYDLPAGAVDRVGEMLDEGMDILDIGAFSSRPGAELISEEEEVKRLGAVLPAIRKEFSSVYISVDTYRSGVAEYVVKEFGVDMINDISAGEFDREMFPAIARLQVPYIIMHMQGEPSNMQDAPAYENVLNEVVKYLSGRIRELRMLGVNDIIADPGFGFGKSMDHNFTLLEGLSAFQMLEVPLLVGLSRKSMIFRSLEKEPSDALYGTVAAQSYALVQGADILRVHDVAAARDTVEIFMKIRESGEID